MAGALEASYPSLNSRTIRALLLQAAVYPDGLTDLVEQLDGDGRQNLHSLAGFGRVNLELAETSTEGRAVLFAEDSLAPDEFHVYRLPMVDDFTGSSGPHAITASLAFDPPVRYRRADYLGFTMDFVVVRGLSRDEVFELASPLAKDSEDKLGKHELDMHPRRTARSAGANQMGRWVSQTKPREQHHEDWHVVVRSWDRWFGDDAGEQPYSLAIAVEASQADQLYSQLEVELQADLRVRV